MRREQGLATNKATVAEHSEVSDCPVLDGTAHREFKAAATAANSFSFAVLAWLDKKDRALQTTWLRRSVGLSRDLVQPWTIEILFLIGVANLGRFSELERALEVSSRTLSDRLRELKEAGLIERVIHDEQPVRIEYRTTKKGRKMAALAAPLIAFLGMDAIAAAPP